MRRLQAPAGNQAERTGILEESVLVDHLGAIRSMIAAEINGAKRYVMLSSINADENGNSRIAHYHRAKARADKQDQLPSSAFES